ncbi:MAG: acyl--CoA ligase family protein [Thermodesulfobacteriota bacterium]
MTDRKPYYDLLTPVSFLNRSAVVFADKIAVVYEDTRLTYRDLFHRVNRLAHALLAKGIGKGDKVAIICPNTPAMIEAHFAVPMIGAALVPINTRLSPGEVSYIVRHSDSRALFLDSEFAPVVAPILGELANVETLVNICDISREQPVAGIEYEEFLSSGSDTPVESAVQDEYDVISINYTSGTTGPPKGVMIHHRGAYLNALGEALELGMDSSSVYLWTLPMFHCNGWCFPWAVPAVGGTQVCMRKVVVGDIISLVERELVSHMCGAPTVLISMLSDPGIREMKTRRTLNVVTAAAPPAPKIIEEMEALGAHIVHVYGLTEVYGPHSICEWRDKWDGLPPEEKARMKARQGVAYLTAMHMDVWDPSTMQPVPRDGKTIGEIVMRGNNVMLGYYKMPEATEEAFRGGWFHSGDLAVMHPDGYVQIKDRSKDIIISGGENISSVEVEGVLYQHPSVLECAVVGVPDPKWGEVPKAFVALKPGANPTADEIISFCRERIAHFKVPKSVAFGELPKTSTGKIKKFELRRTFKEE